MQEVFKTIQVKRYGKHQTVKNFGSYRNAVIYAEIESRKNRNRDIRYIMTVLTSDSNPIYEHYENGYCIKVSTYLNDTEVRTW